MNEIFELIKENVPEEGGLRVFVTLFIAGYYLWPNLKAAWLRYRGRSRTIGSARETLEILKLKYEIESLRKQYDLVDLATEAEKDLLRAYEKQIHREDATIHAADVSPQASPKLDFKRQTLFATLGAILATVWLPIAMTFNQTDDFPSAGAALTAFAVYLIVCIVFGFVAALFPGATKLRTFLSGLFLMVLVQLGLAFVLQ
jgi:hypothetical protein